MAQANGMEISSPVFENEGAIPPRFSCDGDDVSPPLSWSGAPEGTRQFALIVDDPDAPGGTFVHWVYYNIPADASGLPEAVAAEAHPAPGGTQGRNGFGRIGYGGPCPPGGTHRYFFRLYAVDTNLDLEPGRTSADLRAALEGHVLAQVELMGTFSR